MAALNQTSSFLFAKRRSMLNRLKILLEQPEFSALIQLSEKELRTPADQVRLIVRQELIRRGLLPDDIIEPTHLQENHIANESTC
jgi:hypothetical protein